MVSFVHSICRYLCITADLQLTEASCPLLYELSRCVHAVVCRPYLLILFLYLLLRFNYSIRTKLSIEVWLLASGGKNVGLVPTINIPAFH